MNRQLRPKQARAAVYQVGDIWRGADGKRRIIKAVDGNDRDGASDSCCFIHYVTYETVDGRRHTAESEQFRRWVKRATKEVGQ